MAKKTNTEIQKAEQAGALAVPGAEAFFSAPVVENADSSDRLVPVAAMFQGTSEEQERLGAFKLGQIIDAVERRPVASNRFAVVKGEKWYVRWEKGEKTPVYAHNKKADVPAADLEWRDDGKGGRVPPLATETLAFLVVFEGEPWPNLIRFKKTSLKAGKSLYELCERARMQRRYAMYQFDFAKVTGDEGVYAVPDIRQVGDATPEMAKLIVQLFGSFGKKPIPVDEGNAGSSSADDGIPI